MNMFGVEIHVNVDFKSIIEALEKVMFEWPSRLFFRPSGQLGPRTYSLKIDGVGVYYSFVDEDFDGKLKPWITDLFCMSRKVRYLFRQCKGNLRETRNYPGFMTCLVCQACGKRYAPKRKDKLEGKSLPN